MQQGVERAAIMETPTLTLYPRTSQASTAARPNQVTAYSRCRLEISLGTAAGFSAARAGGAKAASEKTAAEKPAAEKVAKKRKRA